MVKKKTNLGKMEGGYTPKNCFYYLKDNLIVKDEDLSHLPLIEEQNIVWINLSDPLPEEVKKIEEILNINILEPQEIEEIEMTSRFINKGYYWTLNFVFPLTANGEISATNVSFVVKGNVLITYKDRDLPLFKVMGQKVKNLSGELISGRSLFIMFCEVRVDLEADNIEAITKNVTSLVRTVNNRTLTNEEGLRGVAHLLELCLITRDALEDMEKGLYALLKTNHLNNEEKERVSKIISDIFSLMEHITFLITRLEYLQNTVIAFINLQLNDIIKIFTVVTVLFMPPTLIASIYGMNIHLPLANHEYGFWILLGIMIITIVLPLLYMIRKKII